LKASPRFFFKKTLIPSPSLTPEVHIKVEYLRGPFCLPTPDPYHHPLFTQILLEICYAFLLFFCIMFIEKYNEKLVVLVPNREQHELGTDNGGSLDSYVNIITQYI
jgi:hypothetical protein